MMRLLDPGENQTILDVGVSDVVGDAVNMLERLYPHPERITAVGLGTGVEFRRAFPKVAYRQIEAGADLPFPDDAFDIAVSNAVLEHVGSEGNQRRFMSELRRVGGRVFVTVPQRYFPLEHHTAIPIAHWTDAGFKLACGVLGKQHWARQENLILMSRRRLAAVAGEGEIGTTGIAFGPFSSNLYFSSRRA